MAVSNPVQAVVYILPYNLSKNSNLVSQHCWDNIGANSDGQKSTKKLLTKSLTTFF